MASSGNFAVWNRLANVNPSLSYSGYVLDKGNIRFRGDTGGTSSITSSLSMPSGKWYIEVYAENNPAGGWPTLGLLKTSTISIMQDVSNYQAYTSATAPNRSEIVGTNGNINAFGSTSGASVGGSAWTSGDILQIAVDIDAGKWWFGKNNTYFNSGDAAAGSGQVDTFTAGTPMVVWVASYNGSSYMYINAGQDSTFSANITAGGNADANGFGDFKYAPPTDFLALCSGNLSVSDDIDPAQTDDNYPGKQMSSVSWTGTAGSKAVTGVGFAPDLVLIKSADQAGQDWCIFDTTRGVQKLLEPSATTIEETNSNSLTAFGTDGFTVGSDNRVNGNAFLMTAQCWKANGGTTASNSEGDITSTVQANTKSGFSICTYTANGSANQTWGHGLSAKPDFIMVKKRSATSTWTVYHSSLGATKYLYLSSTASVYTGSEMWNNTEPTSSLVTVNNNGNTNSPNGATFLSYVWHSVEGYSKFSSYVGSGNADGPFVNLGFMPRCVWIKRTDSSAEWAVYFWNDTSPNTSYVSLKRNPLDSRLTFDDGSMNNGEPVDFLSNGFKIRDTDAILNADGGNYVYMAWGSVPFKYNNSF
jgi:hypothetical protein